MGTFGRLAAVAAMLVIAGSGLCLFDTDHHAASAHSCGSALGATIGILVVVPLSLSGRCVPALAPAYRPHLADLPAPPPKA